MIGRVRGSLAVALSCLAVTASAQQPPRFGERVEVERVLIDARVVDDRGDAIRGLAAADFRLRVDGRPVPLESVQWVSGPAPATEEPEVEIEAPPGRLVVLFFQKDLEPSRATGLLKMIPRALGFLDGYYVLSFEKPPGRRGRHTMDVGLVGRKGNVLARSAYEG
jgi:hypothetical protein